MAQKSTKSTSARAKSTKGTKKSTSSKKSSSRKTNSTKIAVPEFPWNELSERLQTMSKKTQESAINAWEELESERRREILAIPLIAFALISLLSLLSYSPNDMINLTASYSGAPEVQNWIGRPGAWLANGIIFIFGAAGYALPALFLIWGIHRLCYGNQPVSYFRIFGYFLLLVGLSSFLGIFTVLTNPGISEENLWRVCGAIGFILNSRLMDMGMLGALIVNLSVLAVAALICTPLLFSDLYSRMAQFFFPPPREYDDEEDDLEEVTLRNDYDDEITDDDDEFFVSQSKKGKLTLQPLREADSNAIRSYAEENDKTLPELKKREPVLKSFNSTFESDNYNQPDFDDFADASDDEGGLPKLGFDEEKEIIIVTKEDEPSIEIEPSVNLVETPTNENYQLPPISLLTKPVHEKNEVQREEIIYKSQVLEQTLKDFNIEANVVEVNYGPTITCYEIEPAPGIKISKIEGLANDITRSLKAENVRIVAPIPGKGTVGVEVPNLNRSDVYLREMIACEHYQDISSKLKIGLGKTISGEPYIFDLMKAPHLLVAGATGSGKSVCINTIITSLLYNGAPHEIKLLMIDPKQVELALYKDIPHLLSPVVTDPRKAGAALRWAVDEMETRYRYLKKAGVRNIAEFNKKRMAQQKGDIAETETSAMLPGFLPYIVIIIDELADLMMVVRAEVEAMIARLAAMARAVGIHLVLATQRPSVDVLTGVIKNNFPARIAFQVSSTADSRTILDMKGAESLMGRGDMLLSPGGANRPIRLQGSFISTEEAEDICEFVKAQQEVEYVQEEFFPTEDEGGSVGGGGSDAEKDELYDDALQVILENDAASTSLLQRRLKIGYGRAARLLDLMEENGIVGPPRGSKPREIVLGKHM